MQTEKSGEKEAEKSMKSRKNGVKMRTKGFNHSVGISNKKFNISKTA